MSDTQKHHPLPQIGDAAHVQKIMNEKIGPISELVNLGGPEIPMEVEGARTADQKALVQKIIQQLLSIFDPEIPLNIYDLGLIYKLILYPTHAVKIQMTLTAPGCPVAGDIVAEVERKVESIEEVKSGDVELVFDPPWTKERMTEAALLELGLL